MNGDSLGNALPAVPPRRAAAAPEASSSATTATAAALYAPGYAPAPHVPGNGFTLPQHASFPPQLQQRQQQQQQQQQPVFYAPQSVYAHQPLAFHPQQFVQQQQRMSAPVYQQGMPQHVGYPQQQVFEQQAPPQQQQQPPSRQQQALPSIVYSASNTTAAQPGARFSAPPAPEQRLSGSDRPTPGHRATMLPFETTLDQYRQNVKKTDDPRVIFDFAKFLLSAAQTAVSEDRDPKATRKLKESLYAEGFKYMKRLCSQGKNSLPEAQFFLAEAYGAGSLSLPIDHDRAFGLYLQASKMGHPAATYRVAVCYEVGAGTKRDNARAAQFYRKAAALGDTAGMYKLGVVMLNGLLGCTANPREGVSWLKRAAQQADEQTPHALHELGLLYEGANAELAGHVIQDPQYAYELFLQAAQLGYPPSQYKLGLCYEYGSLGLAVDPRRSIAWYTKSAEQGDPEAELALSGWYLTGSEGVLRQSDTEAYLWARRAADKGLAKAEYAVGYYAENGVGVRPDMEEARRWYLRSAGQGNKRAMKRLKELNVRGEASAAHRAGNWRKQSGSAGGGPGGGASERSDCVIM